MNSLRVCNECSNVFQHEDPNACPLCEFRNNMHKDCDAKSCDEDESTEGCSCDSGEGCGFCGGYDTNFLAEQARAMRNRLFPPEPFEEDEKADETPKVGERWLVRTNFSCSGHPADTIPQLIEVDVLAILDNGKMVLYDVENQNEFITNNKFNPKRFIRRISSTKPEPDQKDKSFADKPQVGDQWEINSSRDASESTVEVLAITSDDRLVLRDCRGNRWVPVPRADLLVQRVSRLRLERGHLVETPCGRTGVITRRIKVNQDEKYQLNYIDGGYDELLRDDLKLIQLKPIKME